MIILFSVRKSANSSALSIQRFSSIYSASPITSLHFRGSCNSAHIFCRGFADESPAALVAVSSTCDVFWTATVLSLDTVFVCSCPDVTHPFEFSFLLSTLSFSSNGGLRIYFEGEGFCRSQIADLR